MTAYLLAALDMAGPTVDEGGLVYAALEAAVAEAVGSPVPARLMSQWKGTSKEEAIAGLLGVMGSDDSAAHVQTVYKVFAAKLKEAYGTTPPVPVPGAPEMFETLRRVGVKVALQTGYSAPVADSIMTRPRLDCWPDGRRASDQRHRGSVPASTVPHLPRHGGHGRNGRTSRFDSGRHAE